MKKVVAAVFVLVFVIAAGIFADMGGDEGMEGGMMWMKSADIKAENTADGAKVMITAKDAKEVKEIQEGVAAMVKMHEKMMKEKGEGMEGMWGHGMGMNNGMMMHMQKKMGIAFKFLMVIWSLLILLIGSTTVLVIKKIISK
jgi:hypothetical protein